MQSTTMMANSEDEVDEAPRTSIRSIHSIMSSNKKHRRRSGNRVRISDALPTEIFSLDQDSPCLTEDESLSSPITVVVRSKAAYERSICEEKEDSGILASPIVTKRQFGVSKDNDSPPCFPRRASTGMVSSSHVDSDAAAPAPSGCDASNIVSGIELKPPLRRSVSMPDIGSKPFSSTKPAQSLIRKCVSMKSLADASDGSGKNNADDLLNFLRSVSKDRKNCNQGNKSASKLQNDDDDNQRALWPVVMDKDFVATDKNGNSETRPVGRSLRRCVSMKSTRTPNGESVEKVRKLRRCVSMHTTKSVAGQDKLSDSINGKRPKYRRATMDMMGRNVCSSNGSVGRNSKTRTHRRSSMDMDTTRDSSSIDNSDSIEDRPTSQFRRCASMKSTSNIEGDIKNESLRRCVSLKTVNAHNSAWDARGNTQRTSRRTSMDMHSNGKSNETFNKPRVSRRSTMDMSSSNHTASTESTESTTSTTSSIHSSRSHEKGSRHRVSRRSTMNMNIMSSNHTASSSSSRSHDKGSRHGRSRRSSMDMADNSSHTTNSGASNGVVGRHRVSRRSTMDMGTSGHSTKDNSSESGRRHRVNRRSSVDMNSNHSASSSRRHRFSRRSSVDTASSNHIQGTGSEDQGSVFTASFQDYDPSSLTGIDLQNFPRAATIAHKKSNDDASTASQATRRRPRTDRRSTMDMVSTYTGSSDIEGKLNEESFGISNGRKLGRFLRRSSMDMMREQKSCGDIKTANSDEDSDFEDHCHSSDPTIVAGFDINEIPNESVRTVRSNFESSMKPSSEHLTRRVAMDTTNPENDDEKSCSSAPVISADQIKANKNNISPTTRRSSMSMTVKTSDSSNGNKVDGGAEKKVSVEKKELVEIPEADVFLQLNFPPASGASADDSCHSLKDQQCPQLLVKGYKRPKAPGASPPAA